MSDKEKLQTALRVVKAQCEMLEIEDTPFLRKVHGEAMMKYALIIKQLLDKEWEAGTEGQAQS